MTIDGGYDDDEGGAHHIRDTEPDGDWMTSLSDDDRKTVEAVLEKETTYEVTWTIKLTRTITARSKREAVEISEEMGSGGIESPSPDYEISTMKASEV